MFPLVDILEWLHDYKSGDGLPQFSLHLGDRINSWLRRHQWGR